MGDPDSAPLLSKQLPGAGGSSPGGALSAGSGLIPRMGSSGSLASGCRRLREGPSDTHLAPGVASGAPTDADGAAKEPRRGDALPRAATAGGHDAVDQLFGTWLVSAAPAAADEEFSQDEAASLLLALPLSRCPSNVSEPPSPRVSCLRPSPRHRSPPPSRRPYTRHALHPSR